MSNKNTTVFGLPITAGTLDKLLEDSTKDKSKGLTATMILLGIDRFLIETGNRTARTEQEAILLTRLNTFINAMGDYFDAVNESLSKIKVEEVKNDTEKTPS